MSPWLFRALTLALMGYVLWLLHVQSHRHIPHVPASTHEVEVYQV